MWKLGIAGNELALLSLLSPVLLNFPSFLDLVSCHTGQVSLHFISLIGLVAYKSADPLNRLVLVGIANIVLMLRQVAQWAAFSGDSKGASYQAICGSPSLLGFPKFNFFQWPVLASSCPLFQSTPITPTTLVIIISLYHFAMYQPFYSVAFHRWQ